MLYDRRLKSDEWSDDQIVPRVIEELKAMQKLTGEYAVGGSAVDTYQENELVFPPIRRRQPGRPRVNRITSALEDPDRRIV
ncbi:hypothetical protein FRX31_025493 [Thalictrum thalictroides]|uniref:Uncharacterized protein n=1 Tax=Thalictrum thalictroides TaxID=46969 RepID=A0A7J6VLB9_THATH|nr:hypothetical protein FRX31_025493 [Thalictrum thalictroides]